MNIKGSIALVTGANRGLGLAFTKALLAGGASKVYATARDPSAITVPGVVPIKLDVTDPADVAAVADRLGDVNLLFNNAGAAVRAPLLGSRAEEELRMLLDVNLFGVLLTTRAFAPVLARNGGGAVVNMLSALSWITQPGTGAYAATKAAAWALTNGLRIELKAQKTQVTGVHVGLIDTDMAAGSPVELARVSPQFVAETVLQGIEAGQEEVLVDGTAKAVKAGFNADVPLYVAVSSAR
ncbi:SDR family oxidoreductase [Dyella humicola]|uniref:SDR family oxidoreductase n=1 Tax=Dyella humicola TaxID=2992126 RepID=UPI0022561013|nr:SDR family oxidoreductase [Dyella humicola]